MATYKPKTDDLSIVIAGAAGQGIQTVELLLTKLLKLNSYNFFSTKEYMSRVRGGSNSSEIRVASHPVAAFRRTIDFLLPLNRQALEHVSNRIDSETVIIGERTNLCDTDGNLEYDVLDIPFGNMAKEIGSPLFSNIIAVGVITGLLGIDSSSTEKFLRTFFARKGDDIAEKNAQAVVRGHEIGHGLVTDGTISVSVTPDEAVKSQIVLGGAEAVGFGALTGGCDFVSSYPMSPATAVLSFLAEQSKNFDIIVEQAEDEVAAINMAIGAWYAGTRALVTTSGGGFALMTEGVSLAGMMESPMVIHLAQRPGPATGLPTRTEQADLELALYAGHGEFPRVIFAPGCLEDLFHLSRLAFEYADRYQVPVFVLTDQYLMDTYYNIDRIDVTGLQPEKHIVESDADYRRHVLTDNGLSPRGVPGYGEGLVIADSDTHDERGHLTEDLDMRVLMQDKRMKKAVLIEGDILPPVYIKSQGNRYLMVCWGSTYHPLKEAIERSGRDDVSMLYFKQVYPVNPAVKEYFSGIEKAVIVEGNATGPVGEAAQAPRGYHLLRPHPQVRRYAVLRRRTHR